MKFRLGVCAAVFMLAACSGRNADSPMAGLHGSAGGDALKFKADMHRLPGRDVRHSIANAPDSGVLMRYSNAGKPTKREGAFTYYPVTMSEDHALKGVVTGHMAVPMPDGGQVRLKYERHDESIDGNWTWVGRVEGGDPMQEAIITFGPKAVFASIPQADGKPPLSIRTQGGALYAVVADPSKLRSPSVGYQDMAIPGASSIRSALAAQVQAAQAQVAQKAVAAAAAPSTSGNTIDVAVGYTPGFRAKNQNSAEGATTALAFLIQVANQGFSNSNVNGYLRLVKALEVSYTDANDNQTALFELTGSNGSSQVTVPASLAALRTARDQSGADVALLIRGFQQPEHQGCGIAWLIGAGGANVDPVQDSSWGYGVVSYGDDTGTDGNSYYCPPESMVHEVGHLLGSAHDQANSNSPGRYPYSYGYKSTAGAFYTIMAYGDKGQTPYRIFSNPNLTTCGGNACGVADAADNARSLNQTIPVVAQFRATVVPFITKAPSDFNGDGKSEIHWRNNQTGYNHQWILDGRLQTAWYSVYRETDFNWDVVGTGDFNGDRKADILWRHRGTGRIYIQLMNGSSTLNGSGLVQSVADMGWQLAALADFNNDGVTDILWREINGGRNIVWIMNGLIVTDMPLVYTERDQNWTVIGSGDFNSDGFVDIFWRNVVTGDNYIQFMNGVNTLPNSGRTMAVPQQEWKIITIRDFNLDGRADIYWRNMITGVNALWLMDGLTPASINYVYNEPDLSWKIVNSGDYNGDGYPDLFWRNMANGQNFVQLMKGVQVLPESGYTTAVPDQAWQVTANN